MPWAMVSPTHSPPLSSPWVMSEDLAAVAAYLRSLTFWREFGALRDRCLILKARGHLLVYRRLSSRVLPRL